MRDLPSSYRHWQKSAEKLLRPLLSLMRPGYSEIPLRGSESDHDANADRLEAFARPCLLAALWMQSAEEGLDLELKSKLAEWFRQALVIGTSPQSENYWGPNTNYHQNGVEIGLLVCALVMAESDLWSPLSESEKQQVGHWVASNRGTGHHWNNHMFFGVLALEFLKKIGMARRSDQQAIDYWFDEMETMYRGGGWFMDGMNQSYDHYNAYAFHFYGLLWTHLFGTDQPERSQRWIGWAKEFLDEYQYVFSANGEHPAFGRSITYRFNASAPFSLACLLNVSPMSNGCARRLCTRNLDFFLTKPVYQEQGALGIGWTDVFPEIAEKYSCAGSVYWAAKAFVTLLLPPEHAFWNDPEEPLPAEKSNYVRPQAKAGLIFRATGGEVEILNAGCEITPVNMAKFGPWKWGKLAYRSGVGFQIGHQDEFYGKVAGYYSVDGGLTLKAGSDNRVHGRHYTLPLEIDADHFACSYALGDKVDQLLAVVESYVWWKRDWLFQFHWIDSYQVGELTLGGYALAAEHPEQLSKQTKELAQVAVAKDGRFSIFQPVLGNFENGWDERLSEEVRRSHLQGPFHLTPLGRRAVGAETVMLAAFVSTGNAEPTPALWKVIEQKAGCWVFEHPQEGRWQISHSILPEI